MLLGEQSLDGVGGGRWELCQDSVVPWCAGGDVFGYCGGSFVERCARIIWRVLFGGCV